MTAGIPAVDTRDGSSVLDAQLLDSVEDSSPVRVQQAFRHAGACESFDVQGFQCDGLVLDRHFGRQLVRHILALVSDSTVGFGFQDSCLRIIMRAFPFSRHFFVKLA